MAKIDVGEVKETIEYAPTYLADQPAEAKKKGRWSVFLPIERITTSSRGRVRRVRDMMEFTGVDQDEADRQMVAWIERVGAVEGATP